MMKRRGEREALPLPLYQQKSVFLGLSLYVDQDGYHNDNGLPTPPVMDTPPTTHAVMASIS